MRCGRVGRAVKVADAAEALGITSRTLEHLKQRFVEEGLDAALARRPAQAREREFIAVGERGPPRTATLRKTPLPEPTRSPPLLPASGPFSRLINLVLCPVNRGR